MTYVAEEARVFTQSLNIGAHGLIAAGALLRGDLTFGAHCSVNPYACLSGRVACGDGVRIASLATLVGFDHGTDNPDLPIYRQPLITRGIEIGDDVWIGAGAVILDGARIGSGVVIAAGAVVKGEVPDRVIVGGVPARILRHRDGPAAPAITGKADPLDQLGAAASRDWRAVIDLHRTPEGFASPDAAERVGPAIRHLCDAIELEAGFGGTDEVAERDATVRMLQAMQDQTTGLFPDPDHPHDGPPERDGIALYNVIAVGGALACLDAAPAYPVALVEQGGDWLSGQLDGLDWRGNPWGSGATTDTLGTALWLNRRHFGQGSARETLFGWLTLAADPHSGIWSGKVDDDWLLAVNGFYRASRGSYALHGLPLPYADRTIDTVLTHWAAHDGFRNDQRTACNLLDVVHPLWLCLRQTDHRRAEAEKIAHEVIAGTAERWREGRGLPFDDDHATGLQGTEMWLSAVHTAAAILGAEDRFPFRPQGVHRLIPAGNGAHQTERKPRC
ncbi:acyltransferase [Pelagovum pacificum]|nr:acyltransferase [Pelagovum pacificum]